MPEIAELSEVLKGWDEMTASERNALVAEHVMGWSIHGGGQLVGKTEGGKGREISITSLSRWNPTTDANDMREAVRAFQSIPGGKHWIWFNRNFSPRANPLCVLLAPISDVCLAMLQALAESEAELSEDLKRIEIEIGGEKHALLLPGNGRFKKGAWTIREGGVKTNERPVIMWSLPDGQMKEIYAAFGIAQNHAWFPDACDNAAEWFRKQYEDLNFNPTPPSWHEHYDQCMLWRAAKRAHLALEKGDEADGEE